MRHPPNGMIPWLGQRANAGMCVACLLTSVIAAPTHAQQRPSALELLGKAQSQTERQAVEDLINKLQGRTGANQPTPSTAPIPAPPAPSVVDTTTTAIPTPPLSKQPPDVSPPQAPTTAPAVTASPVAPSAAPITPAVSAPTPTPPGSPGTVAAVEPILPSADIFVYFDFGSAVVDPKAAEALSVLGLALSDARLAKAVFLIAGHTDAKGNPDFNLDLSQRRAQAVRQHLITTYALAPSKLVALGFGDTRLKDAAQPQSEVNRRVQVVNVTAFAQP